jgi:cellobiose-specific phosphotransferase system component IIC
MFTDAHVTALLGTYVLAVVGGASVATIARRGGNPVFRWLGWSGLLAIILVGILVIEISIHCAYERCRIA